MAKDLDYEVSHHAASTAIFPEGGIEKVLVAVYDEGYPVEPFRGHFCLIGGNARRDLSPRATLEREVSEEFDVRDSEDESIAGIQYKGEKIDRSDEFARKEDRESIKNAILSKAKPFRTYLFTMEGEFLGRPTDAHNLVTIYSSFIDPSAFELAEARLKEGKRIRNEGYTGVIKLSDLVNGKIRGAWGYGRILRNVLEDTGFKGDIPEYPAVKVEAISPVLGSYAEYKSRGFIYKKDPES